MIDNFPFILGLLAIIVFIIMIAERLKVAYPILLVISGLAISLVPGIEPVKIEPELIFVLFLPPLLYEASWAISWKELWRWRRIIFSFAFVVVFFTAVCIALLSNYIIPGFSLALGFLLGGIVSPPDAVSTSAIVKFVKVPKRMSSVLEGESLLNDASSLIIFRFALLAVGTGHFFWQQALTSFGWMIVGGLIIGLAIGFVFMLIHRHLPTNANMDIAFTFITPYLMYIIAEELHCSGVISVVSGGLFLSARRYTIFSGDVRLKAVNVWESLCFLLNGFIFILIGLELPEIISGLAIEGIPLSIAIIYGLAITLLLMAIRLVSSYMAVVVTLIAKNFITVADERNPGYKAPLIVGWAGMRGVVSLAAALSIPTHLADGILFPHRNLILFITFTVILLTLVVQGLTLPVLIKKLNINDPDEVYSKEEIALMLKKEVANQALEFLAKNYPEKLSSDPLFSQLADHYQLIKNSNEVKILDNDSLHIYARLLQHQRDWLLSKNKDKLFLDEEIVREHIRFIDLEEEMMYKK